MKTISIPVRPVAAPVQTREYHVPSYWSDGSKYNPTFYALVESGVIRVSHYRGGLYEHASISFYENAGQYDTLETEISQEEFAIKFQAASTSLTNKLDVACSVLSPNSFEEPTL